MEEVLIRRCRAILAHMRFEAIIRMLVFMFVKKTRDLKNKTVHETHGIIKKMYDNLNQLDQIKYSMMDDKI